MYERFAMPLTIAFALTLAAPVGLAKGPAPATSDGPSLVDALAPLVGDRALSVERRQDRVAVRDRMRDEVVLVAAEGLVLVGDPDGSTKHNRVGTRVARGDDGASLYVASLTRLGASSVVFPEGRLLERGLHVLVFDNDDLHVTDGEGALIYAATTAPDGTLTEREGARYGCGCERVTGPDGRVQLRRLPRR